MLQLWFLTHVMSFYWKLVTPVSDFPIHRNYIILITYLHRVKKKIYRILVSYTFLTHPVYVARINRETEGDALGEQSYRHFTQTGHKPRNYHSPGVSHPLSILETKASLTVLSTCLQGLYQPGLLCMLLCCRKGQGTGAGERGGHSWLACPSTDMRHRPCPSGSAFAAVRGLECTT